MFQSGARLIPLATANLIQARDHRNAYKAAGMIDLLNDLFCAFEVGLCQCMVRNQSSRDARIGISLSQFRRRPDPFSVRQWHPASPCDALLMLVIRADICNY